MLSLHILHYTVSQYLYHKLALEMRLHHVVVDMAVPVPILIASPRLHGQEAATNPAHPSALDRAVDRAIDRGAVA